MSQASLRPESPSFSRGERVNRFLAALSVVVMCVLFHVIAPLVKTIFVFLAIITQISFSVFLFFVTLFY